MDKVTLVVANKYSDIWERFTNDLALTDAGIKYKIIRVDGDVENFSFSKAMNQGLKQVDTEYTCFINDDVSPMSENWLGELVKPLEVFDELKAVSPLERCPGFAKSAPKKMPPLIFLNPVMKIKARNYFHGFCIVGKTDAFKEIGGWDENFHHYYEDVDLSVRLFGIGHIAIATYVTMEHRIQTTTKREEDSSIQERVTNGKAYFKRKWGDQFNHLVEK